MVDFEKIRQSIEFRINELYPDNDKETSELFKTVCSQALMISIECLKEYHAQQKQDS